MFEPKWYRSPPFFEIISLSWFFIISSQKRIVLYKSGHKKCPQKVATRSVHKKCNLEIELAQCSAVQCSGPIQWKIVALITCITLLLLYNLVVCFIHSWNKFCFTKEKHKHSNEKLYLLKEEIILINFSTFSFHWVKIK